MSVSAELQKLIVLTLRADAGVAAICAGRIYDGIPESVSYPYVSIGNSYYSEDDADCITGRLETVQLDIWSSRNDRKVECKNLTDAVKKALHQFEGDLGVHALVEMRVPLVRVDSDIDGVKAHGIVQVEARIEEK